jgi:hypothetical protein
MSNHCFTYIKGHYTPSSAIETLTGNLIRKHFEQRYSMIIFAHVNKKYVLAGYLFVSENHVLCPSVSPRAPIVP